MPKKKKDQQLVVSKSENSFLERALKISMNEPGGSDLSFMHSIMCQVGLPKSQVNGTTFERKCGSASILLTAGSLWDGEKFVQQELPYGAMPRLILAYINTYAIQNNTPEIPVGNSKSDFLRILGKTTSSGGIKGNINTFNKQVQALAACTMTLGFNHEGRAHTYEPEKPIKHFVAWIKPQGEQLNLWPAKITLSDSYFKTLKDHAVPHDHRSIMLLSTSALALDIYFMLSERLHRIKGCPVPLRWANLYKQYGQEYIGKNARKSFKDAYIKQLTKVLMAYPKAKVKLVPGGILLMASPPPIPHKT